MGRRPNPILDTGPIGVFATALAELKSTFSEESEAKGCAALSFASMAKQGLSSTSVLAAAAAGKKMPTWGAVESFITACGVSDSEEVEDWRKFWTATQDELGGQLRTVGKATLAISTDGGVPVRGRLRPVHADHAGPDECLPHPEQVRTFEDLCYQLAVLKIAAGSPSLNVLRKEMARGSYTIDHGAGSFTMIGKSTLSEALSGRRPFPLALFTAVVDCLLDLAYPPKTSSPLLAPVPAPKVLIMGKGQPQEWMPERARDLDVRRAAWREAWQRAEFNRVRPDLNHRRRRYGDVVLITPQQDEGPTAGVVAALDPKVAAALLGSLPKEIAAKILGDMPGKQAQEVIKAMVALHERVEPIKPVRGVGDGITIDIKPTEPVLDVELDPDVGDRLTGRA